MFSGIWWCRQVAESLGGDRLGYSVTSRTSVQAWEPVEDISHFNNVHTIKEMLGFFYVYVYVSVCRCLGRALEPLELSHR